MNYSKCITLKQSFNNEAVYGENTPNLNSEL